MALALFRKAEVAPLPDIEAASLRSDRFRLERETDWRRLESIIPTSSGSTIATRWMTVGVA